MAQLERQVETVIELLELWNVRTRFDPVSRVQLLYFQPFGAVGEVDEADRTYSDILHDPLSRQSRLR